MSKQLSYLVPAKNVSAWLEIKRSRFSANVGTAEYEEKAKRFIERVSESYAEATHNCYAFVAGNPDNTVDMGMSDDGEVPGTAGKPMLTILRHNSIGEVVAVVTRYYGGTNLGTGGLVRAYSSTLQLALDNLPLKKRVPLKEARIKFAYLHENSVRNILEQMNIDIIGSAYGESVEMIVKLPESKSNELTDQIMNGTRGEAMIDYVVE